LEQLIDEGGGFAQADGSIPIAHAFMDGDEGADAFTVHGTGGGEVDFDDAVMVCQGGADEVFEEGDVFGGQAGQIGDDEHLTFGFAAHGEYSVRGVG